MVKNWAVTMFSFFVLARATRRLEMLVLDWEANMDLIEPQTSAAISIPITEIRISGERVLSRNERTY
jgi:hypothetical protein